MPATMLTAKTLRRLAALICLLPLSFSALAQSEQVPLDDRILLTPAIRYAAVDGHELLLDLYMPRGEIAPQLLVYVHGGAWRRGSRRANPIHTLANYFGAHGYAIASLDFRLSSQAMFPAQIYDIKAALRYLRANAEDYGYDANRLAILGSSSGGHLVAMMGVSNGNILLEGVVGDHLDQSSDVQAVVSYYGASNLNTILQQSTPFGLQVREPALELLIGGLPDESNELAKLASPVLHVDQFSAPLLMLHGDQDPQMPINQSHELHGAYKENYLPVHLEVLHGAAHGGEVFYDDRSNALVREFLEQQLN